MPEPIPFYHVGPTSTSNPFASVGTDWCPRCRMECEADMAALHHGETFTFKKWCVRCGKVICSGIFNQVCVLTNTPLPPAALEWTFEPGRDRR